MDPGPALRQVLTETEVLLAQAEGELRRLEERVRALLAERQGLHLALVRHRAGGSETPTRARSLAEPVVESARASRSVPWLDLSRSEAVLQVLGAENRPMSRLDIVGALADVGRVEDDADAVSAALAYLRRTGKVERVAAGQWSARDAGGA